MPYPNVKNMCLFTGRITRKCEMKYTTKGTAMLSIPIAVNTYRKNEDGERNDDTTYVTLTLTGERAEKLANYLKIGTMIEAGTTYKCTKVEKDGQTRYYHNFYVFSLEILQKGKDDGQDDGTGTDSDVDNAYNLGADEGENDNPF